MDDVISRQAVLSLPTYNEKNLYGNIIREYVDIEDVKQLPSAQPYTIHSDGRLWITVDDIDKVKAVVVDEHKSKFCKQFYEDYEDTQPDIIRCKDCKHYRHGLCMKASMCVNKSENGFCDWAERRTGWMT